MVSSATIRSDAYLGPGSVLVRLAEDGDLREPAMVARVDAADRVAYVRNARRFESALRYAASCASLAQFDPTLPSFASGAYVPKGLTDANGNLLGTNLENARDFMLDATDALVVSASFVYYHRGRGSSDS